jgi:hypothetical protein
MSPVRPPQFYCRPEQPSLNYTHWGKQNLDQGQDGKQQQTIQQTKKKEST